MPSMSDDPQLNPRSLGALRGRLGAVQPGDRTCLPTTHYDNKRASMAANLDTQTGQSAAEWAAIANQAPVEGFMNTINWLKTSDG